MREVKTRYSVCCSSLVHSWCNISAPLHTHVALNSVTLITSTQVTLRVDFKGKAHVLNGHVTRHPTLRVQRRVRTVLKAYRSDVFDHLGALVTYSPGRATLSCMRDEQAGET